MWLEGLWGNEKDILSHEPAPLGKQRWDCAGGVATFVMIHLYPKMKSPNLILLASPVPIGIPQRKQKGKTSRRDSKSCFHNQQWAMLARVVQTDPGADIWFHTFFPILDWFSGKESVRQDLCDGNWPFRYRLQKVERRKKTRLDLFQREKTCLSAEGEKV